MPHLIIEHSSDISSSSVISLQKNILKAMPSLEGSFDPDQCKCRIFSFDEYLVGNLDNKNSSFIHITIKILSGRSLEAKKKLAEEIFKQAKEVFDRLKFSPTKKDELIETANNLVDAITGIPHLQMPVINHELIDKRCDISVDVVEMIRETYQKIRIGT
jgi:5-carboxymethyl-2-hydroxymuconate isomerase